MARYSAGVLTTAGGTTTPLISLYSAAASVGVLREVGLFNTTSTAVAVQLARFTTNTNAGSGLLEAPHNVRKQPALCTAQGTHSGVETVGQDLGYRAVLGAAVGSAVIWTFGDDGLTIGIVDTVDLVTNGIGVVIENGTGQALQAYLVWDE